MYLWNTANPYRDGDMEAGIVIHELSHGLSTRLTGGPKNSGCLGWGEAGGMGEGWGGKSLISIGRLTTNKLTVYRLPRHDYSQYCHLPGLPHGCMGCQPRQGYPELPVQS
jgi:hypothetical protein